MKKTILKIQGMDCASCAALIESSLKKTKGVSSASVNFAAEKAYLEYNQEEIIEENIKGIITDLGYKTEEESHDHHKEQKENEIKKLKKRFLLSFLFGLPII